MKIHRRDLVKGLAGLALAGTAGRLVGAGGGGEPSTATNAADVEGFAGDDPARAHRFLRDHAPLPTSAQSDGKVRDAIVIGGGLSGLAAAYLLADLDVLLLEKDPMLGGAAKSETWQGIPYALGSAYLIKPAPGEPLEGFYRELGVDREWRESKENEDIVLTGRGGAGGGGFHDFYGRSAALRTARERFVTMQSSAYPDVPYVPGAAYSREEFARIDAMTFDAWLARPHKGEPFAPEIRQIADAYCLGSFGARSTEVSAWAALNFYLAEFTISCPLPGGNAHVARRMAERTEKAGAGRLRSGLMVVAVRPGKTSVVVDALDPQGVLRRYEARTAIFAAAKFLAAHTVEGLPAAQSHACSRIVTRPAMVANLKLTRPFFTGFYGGYCTAPRAFSDLTIADYAVRHTGPPSVVTTYYGMPQAGDRFRLQDDRNFPGFVERVRKDSADVFGPEGYAPATLAGVRLARWGHTYVLPRPGDLSRGVFDDAAHPLGRLVFANQDTQGIPCIEAAILSAMDAARKVRALLAGKSIDR